MDALTGILLGSALLAIGSKGNNDLPINTQLTPHNEHDAQVNATILLSNIISGRIFDGKNNGKKLTDSEFWTKVYNSTEKKYFNIPAQAFGFKIISEIENQLPTSLANLPNNNPKQNFHNIVYARQSGLSNEKLIDSINFALLLVKSDMLLDQSWQTIQTGANAGQKRNKLIKGILKGLIYVGSAAMAIAAPFTGGTTAIALAATGAALTAINNMPALK